MPLGAAKIAYQGYQVVAAAGPRTAETITTFGDAQVDTAQSKFGGASALFDGTGDYLSVTGPDFGASEFTIECWIRLGGVSGVQVIYDNRRPGANFAGDTLWYLNGTSLYWFSNGGNVISASSAVTSTSTWYHVSVSRDSSNNIKMFVNGTQVGSTYVDSSTYSQPDGNAFIGMNHESPNNHYINGHIDEIRVSSTARYTSNFTAPTSAFANDANTLLLIHADGTDGSTTFTDDVAAGRSAVSIVTYGDAQVDTAQSKFGGASALFDGTGDGLLANNDLDLSSGTWTMECFIRFATANTTQIVFDPRFGSQPARVPSLRNGKIAYFNGAWYTGATVLSTNTWYHWAWVYDGSNVKGYVDGTLDMTVSEAGTFIDSKLAIAARYDLAAVYLNAHLDEIRISNSARYTSNFTAPTAAFTNDADTVLLIHCDGADASTAFTDDNS